MSAFVIVSLFALLSFAIRNIYGVRAFAIIGLLWAMSLSYQGYGIELSGFATTPTVGFFEMVVYGVFIAVVLSQKKRIDITQSLFMAVASTLLLESHTLLAFVLSFEALSIVSFILVAHITTLAQADGAIKIFIAGAIATALIFLGLTLYSFEGHAINDAIVVPTTLFGQVGLWLIILAVFYKLTIVPLHSWAVDTYANIAPSHAAILSAIAKSVVALSLFGIFEKFLIDGGEFSATLLIIFSLVTMSLGNILALFEQRLSKIFAYSSIAQGGYIILALVAVESKYAGVGMLYMATAYIFMQSSLFLMLERLSSKPNGVKLNDIKGLFKSNRFITLLFSIQIFSLAGIPLLAGFLGKSVLFYAVVDAGFYLVALVALLNSALSVGYYAWIIKQFYFEDANPPLEIAPSKSSNIAQVILLLGTLYFGVFAYSIFVYV